MGAIDNQSLAQEIAQDVINQLGDGNLAILHYLYKSKGDGRSSLIDWMVDEFDIAETVDAGIQRIIKGLNGN